MTRRAYCFAWLVFAVACGTSGGSDSDGDSPTVPDPVLGALSTDWHPDADGDGIDRADDPCPYVYDPSGSASACDPTANRPTMGGPVTDLIAEHVTPYGGWFSFTSPQTTEYGWDAYLVWSTDRAALQANPSAAVARGDALELDVAARFGDRVARPAIVTSLTPDTSYFVAVLGDGDSTAGNIVEIRTQPAPDIPNRSHPRVATTSAQLEDMNVTGDRLAELRNVVTSEAADSGIDADKYCTAAAVLAASTGDSATRSAATEMLDGLVDYWESSSLTGNEYRWADAALGMCADVLWNELSSSERNRIARALLDTDEQNLDIRFDDTDELAAAARTRIIDGLLLCGASSLDSNLSERGCAIRESGLRLFYGVQLVKARRDRGVFAQSGGHLPDGIGYAQGTLSYWLQTFHALSNAGVDVAHYAPFVLYAALSNGVHALTPMRRGLATFGDLDQTQNPDEPNGYSIEYTSANLFALAAGLLERWGATESAGWIRSYTESLYAPSTRDDVWAGLVYGDGLAIDYTDDLPTGFLDSGMGIFYDRTSWDTDASFLTFRAGWSGVDHSHEDAGSFQLYRDGRWVTHEALGYSGDASTVAGKNAPLLEVDYEELTRPGQFVGSPADRAHIVAASSGDGHAFLAADLRGPYTSHYHHSYGYDTVERQLLWLKRGDSAPADVVVVYDIVDSAGAPGVRQAQLHLDSAPSIAGRSASIAGLSVHAVLPESATLSARTPEGPPHQYPGEIYTHRVIIDPGHSDPSTRLLWAVSVAEDAGDSPIALEGDDYVGVLFGTRGAVFAKDGSAQPPPAAPSIAVPGDGPYTLVWSGLTPGASYDVDVSSGRVELSAGARFTADDGGVLQLEIDP